MTSQVNNLFETMASWTLPTCIQATYDTICDGTEWLDRRCIDLTEKAFQGNVEAAAISRVALKTLATLSLFLVSPFPTIVNFLILGVGQSLLSRGDWDKPWYITTACLTNLFLQSITCSHPLIELVATKGTGLSIILNGISALGTGFELCQHTALQCLEELKASFLNQTREATGDPTLEAMSDQAHSQAA